MTKRDVSPMVEPTTFDQLGTTARRDQSECILTVKRTGNAVTVLYLSFHEPETAWRLFNELFFLMGNPALDKFFQQPSIEN